jgi:DNA-binding NarL/FixJ family response regulator
MDWTTSTAPAVPEQCLQTALHAIALDVMVVDVEGRLLYANRSAQAELAAGTAFRLRGTRICCATESQQEALARALQGVLIGRRSMIELGSGLHGRMHAVIPMQPEEPGQPAQALLLSGVRDPFGPVTLTLFAKVAGLTASERDVLISLCRGLAANDIAAQREVCISTVRTQIVSIREKVGARTVTQMIRKISALPPMSLA